jgi:DNA-binding transcriptional MerR regulator
MASPQKAYMSATATSPTANILPEKSLFRIGEVSRITAIKAFVLRYWETEFPMLQPEKTPSGHRLYRREDVQTVLEIRRLLYDEGFTIAGARRHLRERGIGANGAELESGAPQTESASTEQSQSNAAGAPVSAEPRAQQTYAHAQQDPLAAISRKTLLDLRDSLRAFLTLLKTE